MITQDEILSLLQRTRLYTNLRPVQDNPTAFATFQRELEAAIQSLEAQPEQAQDARGNIGICWSERCKKARAAMSAKPSPSQGEPE